MIEFLLSPILSLFSPRFYQGVFKSSITKGFLYLLYLSLLGSVAFLFIIYLKWMPTADNFVIWFSHELPEISFQNGTLSSAVAQPHVLIHPKFGKILILNTKKDHAEPAEMKEAFVYVTSRLIYVSNPFQRETKIFDVAKSPDSKAPATEAYIFNGDLVKKIYAKIKPVFLAILVGFTFIFIFMWKLTAAIFYSMIAFILNLFREEKFSYEKLLNVSMFAMTAVTLLQFLNALVTSINLPVPLWVAFTLTTCYLGLAILVVSPPEKLSD